MVFLRISLLLALISIGFFANGQRSRSDTVKMICQNWKIKEMKIDGLDEDDKEDLEDMINYTRIEFKSDMTTIDRTNEVPEKGKWKLDITGKLLSIISAEEEFRLEIISLSPSLLQFKAIDPGGVFGYGSLVPVKK